MTNPYDAAYRIARDPNGRQYEVRIDNTSLEWIVAFPYPIKLPLLVVGMVVSLFRGQRYRVVARPTGRGRDIAGVTVARHDEALEIARRWAEMISDGRIAQIADEE